MNYDLWGQHTVAEARYADGVAVHVRIPTSVVIAGRQQFAMKDVLEFEPHIDLHKVSYQAQVFNGSKGNSYINGIPLAQVEPFLWYIRRHPTVADTFLGRGIVPYSGFMKNHTLPTNAGKQWLHLGHEKYGIFDAATSRKSFNSTQVHRIALYGAFLRAVRHEFQDRDLDEALPEDVKEGVSSGLSLIDAVDREIDGQSFSIIESFTLIVDDIDPGFGASQLRVCKNHDQPVYWADYQDRKMYRVSDPQHPQVQQIEGRLEKARNLEVIVAQECPACNGTDVKF
ncbi:MAG TPA: hypothetical protein VJH97_02965 [Candidatus Nanoarchaeia archaeon]|nr:hypothetical protein [Candidatus Nanoarchaeia archaeon]